MFIAWLIAFVAKALVTKAQPNVDVPTLSPAPLLAAQVVTFPEPSALKSPSSPSPSPSPSLSLSPSTSTSLSSLEPLPRSQRIQPHPISPVEEHVLIPRVGEIPSQKIQVSTSAPRGTMPASSDVTEMDNLTDVRSERLLDNERPSHPRSISPINVAGVLLVAIVITVAMVGIAILWRPDVHPEGLPERFEPPIVSDMSTLPAESPVHNLETPHVADLEQFDLQMHKVNYLIL